MWPCGRLPVGCGWAHGSRPTIAGAVDNGRGLPPKIVVDLSTSTLPPPPSTPTANSYPPPTTNASHPRQPPHEPLPPVLAPLRSAERRRADTNSPPPCPPTTYTRAHSPTNSRHHRPPSQARHRGASTPEPAPPRPPATGRPAPVPVRMGGAIPQPPREATKAAAERAETDTPQSPPQGSHRGGSGAEPRNL